MKVQREMSASMEDVQSYADVASDYNPVHVDEAYPEYDDTFADENIVHGALLMGWFSGVLNEIGNTGPLRGEVILINMDVEFFNPLPVDTSVCVGGEISPQDVPDDDDTVVTLDVSLTARDRSGTIYASGTATIMVDQTVTQRGGTI